MNKLFEGRENKVFLEFSEKNIVSRVYIKGDIRDNEVSDILEIINNYVYCDGDMSIFEFRIVLNEEGIEVLFYVD